MKSNTHNLVAACAGSALLLAIFSLQGCAGFSPSLGLSFPIGGIGNVGVSVGADGRIGGSVGVGVGGASVSVGTSGQLPTRVNPDDKKTDAPAKATEATKPH